MEGLSISFLIVTYNRKSSLEELLDRLVKLFNRDIVNHSAEIIVFDDGSTDGTSQVCARFSPYIEYIYKEKNTGSINARKELMFIANGEYLVFLDDDSCLIDEDALQIIREAFANDPKCSILAANIADPNHRAGQLPLNISPRYVSLFVGCGYVIRRDHIQHLQNYSDLVTSYGAEETLIALRILDEGFNIVFLPRLRVYHARDSSNRNQTINNAHKFLNEIVIVLCAFPLWTIAPVLLYKLISWICYLYNHNSMFSLGLVFRKLPDAISVGIRNRKPIKYKTFTQFYRRRNDFLKEVSAWQKRGNNCIWQETLLMYK